MKISCKKNEGQLLLHLIKKIFRIFGKNQKNAFIVTQTNFLDELNTFIYIKIIGGRSVPK